MAELTLLAMKGIQAGQTYYMSNMMFCDIVKSFEFISDDLPIEAKYQRELNLKRAEAFSQYLLKNHENKQPYVIPTIIASVTECRYDDNTNLLFIPPSARMIINDGQHRREGIKIALEQKTDLAYETVGVQLYFDPKLKRAQQIFSDINFNAKPVTKSLSLTFNKRDSDANTTQSVVNGVPLFYRFTEREKPSVNSSATKVFLYSNLHSVINTIFEAMQAKKENAIKYQSLIKHYFNCLAVLVDPYQALVDDIAKPKTIRQNYIATHGITLDAFAQIGAKLLSSDEFISYKPPESIEDSLILDKLQPLVHVDWSKNNEDWQGTIIYQATEKIISTNAAKNWLANYLAHQVFGEPLHVEKEKKAKQLNLLEVEPENGKVENLNQELVPIS